MSRLALQRARRKIVELEYENMELKKKLEALRAENVVLNRRLGIKPKGIQGSEKSKVYLTLDQMKEMVEVSPKIFVDIVGER